MAKARFQNLLKEVSRTSFCCLSPRRKRLGYGKFIAAILFALSLSITATAQTRRVVDMPGTEVLDTLGIHPLMDAYDNYERLTSFQLYQRGARLGTLQRAGEERFVKDPKRLATDILVGLDMSDIVYNELERELVE